MNACARAPRCCAVACRPVSQKVETAVRVCVWFVMRYFSARHPASTRGINYDSCKISAHTHTREQTCRDGTVLSAQVCLFCDCTVTKLRSTKGLNFSIDFHSYLIFKTDYYSIELNSFIVWWPRYIGGGRAPRGKGGYLPAPANRTRARRSTPATHCLASSRVARRGPKTQPRVYGTWASRHSKPAAAHSQAPPK